MNKLDQLLAVIHSVILADHEIRIYALIDIVHRSIPDRTDLQRAGNCKHGSAGSCKRHHRAGTSSAGLSEQCGIVAPLEERRHQITAGE